MIVQLATFLFDLLLPLVVGYMLVRTGRFDSKSFDPLVSIAIIGLVPFLVLLSFWNVELNMDLLLLPILGLIMQLVPGAISWFIAYFKNYDSLEKGSYVLSNLLCNRGVLGGLAVFILFGEEAYAYAQLITMLGMPVLLAIGFPMANYYHRSHHGIKKAKKSILTVIFDKRQIAFLGLGAGFALNITGIDRPEAFGTMFSVIIHIVAWSLLIPVGASINFRQIGNYWKGVIDIVPHRFVLCPILFYFIGKMAGLEGTALYTVIILSATPTAINAVVTAKLYELNIHIATAAFVITTSFYLVIIFPVLLVIMTFIN